MTTGERVKFLMTLQREADVPEGDGLLILRNAATLQRLAVERCNRELTAAEGRELTTVALIRQLLRDGLTRERKRVERL